MMSKFLILPVCVFFLLQGKIQAKPKPNIIFILVDDMGYGDLGVFGSTKNRTPVLDQMAKEGIQFTSFNTHSVCGPTRAAIMTGCYTMRIAELKNQKKHHPAVHPNEYMIPQFLKPEGYTSAVIGKWDLNGHKKDFKSKVYPSDFGFDYSYGRLVGSVGKFYENEKIAESVPLELITKDYTNHALSFIDKNKSKPFFLYLSHAMPHVPLAASKQFRGKSKNGLYGDVIEELDWNIGRVFAKLKELKIDKNTIVIFCSDNGPWPYWTGPENSGETGLLRGQKCETWEGGVRTPFIIRAPNLIPEDKVSNEMIGDIDILPTIVAFAGGKIPEDRIIDGKNLKPLILGEISKSPVNTRYFYYDTHLQAVRYNKWKLILKRPKSPPWLHDKGLKERFRGRDVEAVIKPQLYDLEKDVGETLDLSGQYPNIVNDLLKLAEKARIDIGDYDYIGKGARFYDKEPKRPEVSQWKNN